jgi:hypothetical protein
VPNGCTADGYLEASVVVALRHITLGRRFVDRLGCGHCAIRVIVQIDAVLWPIRFEWSEQEKRRAGKIIRTS